MKFNIIKKLLCGAAVAASLVTTSFAASPAYVVKLLDSYSQLGSYTGKDGIYFVREAGKGQNSDPSVASGWAVYVYDGRTSKFKLISKQEAMGGSAGIGAAYLTEALYKADITPYKYQIRDADALSKTNSALIASLKSADVAIVSSINELTTATGTLGTSIALNAEAIAALDARASGDEASISNVTDRVARLETTSSELGNSIGELNEGLTNVNQKIENTAEELRGYTDIKVADLKVDIITNTAVRMRATLTTATNFANQVKVEALQEAAADATVKDAVVLETATTAASTAKSEALTEAKAYTDGATNGLLSVAQAEATYLKEHQDLSGKADKADLFRNGQFYTAIPKSNGTVSSLWNEAGGGGIMLEDGTSNIKTAVAVNEGGAGPTDMTDGLYIQQYAIDKDSKLGARLTISSKWGFLTYGNTYRWTPDDALVVKRDLAGYLTEHQDISGKLDKSVIFPNGSTFETSHTKDNGTVVRLWNESTGGGAQVVDGGSGVKAFVGVNEGSADKGDGTPNNIYVQQYAINNVSKVGSRITINQNGAYYTRGKSNPWWEAKDEIVIKEDLEAYQPKGNYIVEGDALELPLKVRKNGVVYQIDVVDNGGDDISLSINKVTE